MEMQQAKPYISVIERMAQEEGWEEGRKEEAVRLLLRLLTHRFGSVAEAVQPNLDALTIEQIEPLVDLALAQATLAAFVAQLPAPPATQ